MRIAIAGASGLVGTALEPVLREHGHEVIRLVRRTTVVPNEVSWNPATGEIDLDRLGVIDAVINLAGENLGQGRWTKARRERIFRSRVDATRTLVSAIKRMPAKPQVFLSASAVGFYGDRGDELLDETSSLGQGFLPEVCLAWETHAEGAQAAGIRTVLLRFGVILAGQGGALAKMLPLFRLGLGGRLGSGDQWMSWVAIDDVTGAIVHLLRQRDIAGPVNIVAPQPVTNRAFTAELATALRRSAILPAPAWALRLVLGRGMADEALLASTRAVPEKLMRSGYAFRAREIADSFRAIL
jgi:uncharacterized protein (TIGR01777 family)